MTDNFFRYCRPHTHSSYVRLLLICLSLLNFGFHALAQELDSKQQLNIRRVYVPQGELQTPLHQDGQGVIVSPEEFDKLAKQLRAHLQQSQTGLGQLLIERTDYDARLDGDRLRATLTVTINNAATTWSTALIRVGNWSIESGELQKPGPNAPEPVTPWLVRTGEQQSELQLFVMDSGRQQLKLELSHPVQAIGGDKQVTIALTGAAVGKFRMELPARKYLQLEGLDLPRPAPAADETTYVLPIGGFPALSFTVTDRQQTERADVLTFASTAYGISVAPGQVTWTAMTGLQVFGKPIDRLVCTVPNSLEITGIESEGLESWELADAPDQRTSITLQYRQPFDKTRGITFRGIVSSDPSAPWTVPNLRLGNVTSHVGSLVVSHPSGIRLQAVEAKGIRAVTDLAVVDGLVPPGNFLRYQLWDEDFVLSFSTSAKQQEVRGAMTNVLDVNDQWLDLYTSVNLETRFAPLFEARIQFPADWMIVRVTENNADTSRWSIVPAVEGQELRVELSQPLQPGESREISVTSMRQPAEWPVSEAPQTQPLPEVRLPQAGMVEALYGITADAAFDLVPQQLVGLDAARQEDVSTLNQRLVGIQKQVRLGFTYQDSRFSGQLEIRRKPATLLASNITFARLERDQLALYLQSELQIQGGGVRELQLATDEQAGADLRFQLLSAYVNLGGQGGGFMPAPARIVEQSAQPPVDGLRVWTLKLDRYLIGPVIVQATANIPRTDDDAAVSIPHWQVQGSEQQSGFIAVESGSEQRVAVTAQSQDGSPLRMVDPIDFPPARYVPTERVVAGYQHVRPDWQVSIQSQEFERQPVPTAIGESLKLSSILNQSGEIQTQANLTFSAVGVQSLRVRLPQDTRLWSMLLDGTPVEVRKTESGFEVPLFAQEGAARRTIEFLYVLQTPALSHWGEFTAAPPTFAAVAGAGATLDLEVLQQEWQVASPSSLTLLGSHGQFEPTSGLDRSRFFGDLTGHLMLPARNRALAVGVAGLIVLIVLSVVRFILTSRHGGLLRGLFVLVIASCVLWYFVSAVQVSRYAPTTASPATAPMELYDMEFPMSGESAPMAGYEMAAPAGEAMTAPIVLGEEDRAAGARIGLGGASEVAEGAVPFRQGSFDDPQALGRLDTNAGGAAPPMPQLAAPQSMSSGPGPGVVPPANEPAEAQMQQEFVDQFSNGIADPQSDSVRTRTLATAPVNRAALQAGALLSMTVALAQPADSRTYEFTYRGNGVQGVDLKLQYADLQVAQMLLLAIASGVLLLGWWLRKSSLMKRSLFILLTIAIPWGLAPLLPTAGQLLAESLLFGGLATMLLWTCYEICCWVPRCCRNCCQWLVPEWARSKTTTCLLALLALTGISQAGDEGPHPLCDEPYVIIPYGPNEDPLQAQHIFIPHDLYRQLFAASHPEEQPGPEVHSHIASALYSAELAGTGDSARIEVTGRLVAIGSRTQLANGAATEVILPFTQVSLTSVAVDGQAAAVRVTAEGNYAIPLSSLGQHVIDVAFEVPARLAGPTGNFQLNLSQTAAAKLELTLPAKDLEIHFGEASAPYQRYEVNGSPRLALPVDRAGTYTLNWRPRKADLDVTGTLQAETAIAAFVEEAGLSVNHAFVLTPRQQKLAEMVFDISPGAIIRRIAGEDVGGWEMTPGDAGTQLRVYLRQPVDRPTRIDLDLFQTLTLTETPEQFPVPVATPRGVASETGLLGVFGGDQFTVRGMPGEWITQINNDAFQPNSRPVGSEAQPLLAYRFVMRPFGLSFSLSRRPPVATTIAEHGVSVDRRKLTMTSQFQFNLTGAPRPSVSLEIPADYLPIDVTAEHMVDWYMTQLDDRRILTVELDQPHLGSLLVYLEGRLPKTDDLAASMSFPVPVDISRLTSTAAVWLEEGMSGVIGSSGRWRSLDPSGLSASLRELDSLPPQFAFRSTELSVDPVSLTLQQTQPDLQADAVTLIAVTEATIDYGLTLRWKITRAAADTFQFTTPAWMEGHLDLNVPGVRQVLSQKLADDRLLWTISLIDPVRDNFVMTAAATLPAPQDRLVNAPLVQFQQGTPDALQLLEFQRHYAILVNLSSGQIVPVDVAQLESVSREELPLQVSEQLVRQAMEIARVRPGRVPVWQVQSMATQQQAAATVTAATLVTAIEADGSWRTRAVYTLRNRGRQFLGLHLPEGSRLLSVLVKGLPGRTVTTTLGGKTVQLVALPQTSEADLSFDIQLIVAGQLDRPLPTGFNVMGAAIDVPVPQVVSPEESAEFGLTVAQTQWNVYLPEDFPAYPLRDIQRSNLTWTSGRDIQTALQLSRLESIKADVAEMVRLANDPNTSLAQQFMCASNLKQLDLGLEGLKQQSSSVSSDWSRFSGSQIQSESSRVQGELRKSLSEIEQKRESGQQAFEVDGEAQQGQAAQRGRSFIEFNNRDNLQRNYLQDGGEATKDAQSSRTFRKKSEMDEAKQSKPDEGRSALKGKFMQQNVINGNSLNNAYSFSQAQQGLGGGRGFSQMRITESEMSAQSLGTALTYDMPNADYAGLMFQNSDGYVSQPPAAWDAAGGLSLAFEIPVEGKVFSFTKIGGDPKLTFQVRGRDLSTCLRGGLWSVVWLILGFWSCHWLARLRGPGDLVRIVAVVLIFAGIVGALLLPQDLAMLNFILGVFGGIVLVATTTAKSESST